MPLKSRTPRAAKPKKLPKQLVANANAAHRAALARIKIEAEEDRAIVIDKKREIMDGFFEMGAALSRLQRPAAIDSLGAKTFTELCEKQLAIPVTNARELIAIATRVPRSAALRWGREKAEAVVAVAHSLDPNDASVINPKQLQSTVGDAIDVEASDARAIHNYAKTRRQAGHKTQHGHAGLRGRTTTAEERGIAMRIAHELAQLGVSGAIIAARASQPGRTSNIEIRGVPIDQLEALEKALASARRDVKKATRQK